MPERSVTDRLSIQNRIAEILDTECSHSDVRAILTSLSCLFDGLDEDDEDDEDDDGGGTPIPAPIPLRVANE